MNEPKSQTAQATQGSGLGTDNSTHSYIGPGSGFSVLFLLILFVAYWMYDQGRQAFEATDVAAVPAPSADLSGFDPALGYLPDDDMLGFVEIPAGEFLMGSNPAFDRQAYENERWSQSQRQGAVTLPTYYISRYEVTVAQYQAFLNSTGHSHVEQALTAPANHPITNITWTDALAYTRWLQAMLTENSATPAALRSVLDAGWLITLPSEAQWEKSARGSSGAIYPWGIRVREDAANFNADATSAVGSFRCTACQFGLSDMSGNVWEMTRSPLQPYPYSEDDDMEILGEDALFVMKGGSFSDSAANIRAAVRGGVDPGVRSETIGFRIALSNSNMQ